MQYFIAQTPNPTVAPYVPPKASMGFHLSPFSWGLIIIFAGLVATNWWLEHREKNGDGVQFKLKGNNIPRKSSPKR